MLLSYCHNIHISHNNAKIYVQVYMHICADIYIYIYIYIYINSRTKFETLVWRLMKGLARN